jgi:thymidylate kinase
MKVIEFIGMARAGKTTQIDRLKSHLESQGQRVVVLSDRERAQSLKTPPNEGLAYTLIFFAAAIEAYYTHLNEVDYLLIDRGFNDVAVWSDVRFSFGEISREESDALKIVFERFKQLVDQTIYFKVPIEVGLSRHQNTQHQAVDDVAMNKKWLEVLQSSYEKNLKSFKNVISIDGTQEVNVVEAQVVEAID